MGFSLGSIGSAISSIGQTIGNFTSSPVGQAVTSAVTQGASGASGMDGASSGDKKDAIKQMIEGFIWENMKKMREDSEKKLEEAMKKKG